MGCVFAVLAGRGARRRAAAHAAAVDAHVNVGPLSTRSVSFKPRAVRMAAFGAAQKSGPVDAVHPHEGPKNPPGRCDLPSCAP